MTRVLVVDDKSENLYYLRALLSGHGFEVDEARHGAEALVIARNRPPDLIISDLLMPVMDGYTLLRYWKSDPVLRTVPFIVYTATYTEEKDAQLAMDLGADAFLLKPSEPHELLQRIEEVRSAGGTPQGVRRPSSAQAEVMQVYSEALIRKLEEKSLQLADANKRLGRSALQLEMAGRLARLGGWWVDVGATHVGWSDEVCRIHGEPEGSAPDVGAALNYYEPAHRPLITEALNRCIESGTPFDLELEIIARGGRRVKVRAIGEAVRDEGGQVTRVQGAFQDVTDMRREQRERVELAERLQMTLDTISDAVVTFDANWVVRYLNREGERVVRVKRDEVVGEVLWDAFPEAKGSRFETEFTRAMTEQRTVHFVDYYPPLSAWLEITAYPTLDGLAVYFRDITSRREAERKLATQATLLDKAQDAILVRGLDDIITFWNKGAERLYGWTAEEAIGKNSHDLINDKSEDFVVARRELLERGEWAGTLRQVRQDRRRVIAECRWTLVRNDEGEPESILAINTDVTDRRSLEQQFLRAQRLESIGTLAGGIAHDLNNVLSPVMMSLGMLREMTGASGHELIDSLQTSVNRGAELVRQVLTFARGLDGRKERVDVHLIQREIETVVRDTFPKSIRVVSEATPEACLVTGDGTQLHQVFMNLTVNARDAMPHGGTLTIRLGREVLSPSAATALGLSVGEYVRLDVGDDGEGIAPEQQEVIFEPFFTTKDIGRGTGLGLSTVQSIVRGLQGAIGLQSALGQGSVFTCWFPLAQDDVEAAAIPAVGLRLPRGNGECILLVDDEDAIRDVADRILTRYGYKVLLAANGREGLALFLEHEETIDAIITDISMPEMDGPTFIAALRAEGVQVPVIVSSGFVEEEGAGGLLNTGSEFFISKPFTVETLLTTLRGVLVGLR